MTPSQPSSEQALARLQQKHEEFLAELAVLKKRYKHLEAELDQITDKSKLKKILEKISTM